MSDHSLPPSAPPPTDSAVVQEDSSTPPAENKPTTRAFNIFGGLQSVLITAFLIASFLTLFTPTNLFSGEMLDRVLQAWQANPTTVAPLIMNNPPPETLPIGIVSGHWKNDSGAVCSDGLKEEEVNLQIATLVQQKLIAEGYKVDLLSEFDDRLSQYKAIALVSIHADTCDFIDENATGFKVAAAMDSAYPEKANRLTLCLADRYAAATGLTYLVKAPSDDMTYYHTFNEIHTETTAAIIETGFLNLDRQLLTENPDKVAQGIVNGILCYIRNENIALPTATP
ncbi:MAG TPA: N-acetylmuramoyl-L-alanine amidase [Anaerolineaceae bacterium]|nr:N-acetylmuramoyl-L-alanine amidase [Anaerolineaceae bacterium]